MKTIFTHFAKVAAIFAFIFINVQTSFCQFTPGEGGSLTFTDFTPEANKFGGFYITESDRANHWISGTEPMVDMEFPTPASIGADSYTLQFSTDNGASWNNYQWYSADLVTPSSSTDNFSLSLDGNYKLRLLVNGGEKNGYTSNEVDAPLSTVDTRVAGWSLDESMWISGIMAPFVGRGLDAGFTMRDVDTDTTIIGYLTYQWYRVNPVTFEMTAIPGADSLTYITTGDDNGYYLIIKATGDEVNVGGFAQILSTWGVKYSNNAFASNITTSGFTLNLYKTVGSLTVSDLTLRDTDWNEITIDNVTQGANGAIWNITAALDSAKNPYYLTSDSYFWALTSSDGFMTMEGLNVDVISGINNVEATQLQLYPLPAKDVVNFTQTNTPIEQINIYNLSGAKVYETSSVNGTINVSNFDAGLYFVRFSTANGDIVKKLEVMK